MSSVQAKGGTRSARVLYHQCIEGEGWGTFFSAKSLLDIYNIFRVPYKTISMKSSLLFSVSHSFATLCFPTCSFLALTVLSHCSTGTDGVTGSRREANVYVPSCTRICPVNPVTDVSCLPLKLYVSILIHLVYIYVAIEKSSYIYSVLSPACCCLGLA